MICRFKGEKQDQLLFYHFISLKFLSHLVVSLIIQEYFLNWHFYFITPHLISEKVLGNWWNCYDSFENVFLPTAAWHSRFPQRCVEWVSTGPGQHTAGPQWSVVVSRHSWGVAFHTPAFHASNLTCSVQKM